MILWQKDNIYQSTHLYSKRSQTTRLSIKIIVSDVISGCIVISDVLSSFLASKLSLKC